MRRWSRPSNRTGDYSKNGRTGATRPKLRLITLNLGNAGLGVERQNQARTNEIMTAMEKVKFDIIGLSETHTQKAMKSEKWTDGQLAGTEIHTSKQDGKIGGVGFIVHKEMTKFVQELDVRSDHKAIRATLNMDKGKVRKTRPQKEILEPILKESIKAAEWKTSERRITRRYEEFLSTLKKCLINAEKEKVKNHCPRITDDTAKMLKALAEEKRKGTNPQECKRLSKSVRKKLESDYEEYKTMKLLETAKQRKSLKQCARKAAQTRNMTYGLRNKEGTLKTNRSEIEEICQNFYTDLFASKTKVERIRKAAKTEETIPRLEATNHRNSRKRMDGNRARQRKMEKHRKWATSASETRYPSKWMIDHGEQVTNWILNEDQKAVLEPFLAMQEILSKNAHVPCKHRSSQLKD
ncbi:hypothetical protein DdX_22275 [Ditylenchus destructor]|uniref:Endonuclease/exonuclease/phosphatase domain-containing protein n=1 Tax=Ditylenchus destructor TaxID=166010 RepID=A0AAD4QUK6_9BILA|nr:hypothetical protein DdX_22275 [Ditylenchus destructor]